MSQQLISRSDDLKRLQDDGYDIEVRSGHLLVKGVPYVNANRAVQYGILVSVLDLVDNMTKMPDSHVALFVGEHPCHTDGSKFHQIEHGSSPQPIDRDLVALHSFSSKPYGGRYKDYYEKMTTYVAIISGPAQQIDATVTARTYPVITAGEDESPFHYIDTASSRAGISAVSRKLELGKVAIIGVGGTGSYVLDLVAKTPAKEIHIFDGDAFSQHNAFRSPGAPSGEQLRTKPTKAAHFKDLYSNMHRHIIAHETYVGASNLEELRGMDFVFISVDGGGAKRHIVESLLAWNIPFIDVGLGVQLDEGSLGGVLRVTTSSKTYPSGGQVIDRIPFSEADGNDDYRTNIQVADLNALNAALAVIKWKKLFGFYRDMEGEHFSTYTIDGNNIINEDKP